MEIRAIKELRLMRQTIETHAINIGEVNLSDESLKSINRHVHGNDVLILDQSRVTLVVREVKRAYRALSFHVQVPSRL
jgi:hypothetical protein